MKYISNLNQRKAGDCQPWADEQIIRRYMLCYAQLPTHVLRAQLKTTLLMLL